MAITQADEKEILYGCINGDNKCQETLYKLYADKMYALCDLSNEQLLGLYENRTVLNQDDVEYADYVWQLYCSDNPIRLENLSDYNDYKFDYLSDAIQEQCRLGIALF